MNIDKDKVLEHLLKLRRELEELDAQIKQKSEQNNNQGGAK